MDEFTEVSSEGWFSRIGGAIKGILVGLVMFIIAWPLIFWNEGRTVKRARLLDAGLNSAITVSADQVNPANEGKLVHLIGDSATDDVLEDAEFGISLSAIQLSRKAEMYQWEEDKETKTKKKTGGGTTKTTTYSYDKEWSTRVIDSSNFKKPDGHQNPGQMKYQGLSQQAKNVSLQAFKLSQALINQHSNLEPLAVSEENAKLPPDGEWNGGGVYIGEDPGAPQVGDIRLQWSMAPPTTITVLGKQLGNTFESWTPPKGGKALEQILRTTSQSKEELFAQEASENKMLAWLVRAGGLVLMWLGMFLFFKPIAVVADVLPFLGNLAETGIGFVAFLIALPCTLIAIAIGWFAYRPVLSIALVAGAIACVVLLRVRQKKSVQGSV